MAAKPLTMAELERALVVAAQVVEHHGPKFLPVFELMEQEYNERRRQGSAIDRARLIASQAVRAGAALPNHLSA